MVNGDGERRWLKALRFYSGIAGRIVFTKRLSAGCKLLKTNNINEQLEWANRTSKCETRKRNSESQTKTLKPNTQTRTQKSKCKTRNSGIQSLDFTFWRLLCSAKFAHCVLKAKTPIRNGKWPRFFLPLNGLLWLESDTVSAKSDGV